MKTPLAILYTCLLLILVSCSKEFASPKDTNIGVFDELLQFVEENYALFEVKQIDWALVKARYRPKVSNLINQDSFFSICQNTFAELKDGQSFINGWPYPRPYDYTVGYNVQFNREVARGYAKQAIRYFHIGTWAGTVNDTTVYVYLSFLSDNDSDNWQNLVTYLALEPHKKIILDLRDASGGTPKETFSLASYFIAKATNVGSMVHKSGKGSGDFKKTPVVISPASPYLGDKKIVILTSRRTFNVATYFSAILQTLPNVTLIGQTTGPGSGIELPYELPNGWIVAVSSNYFLPANGRHIEDGIKPTIEINNTALDLQNKRDRMLERAIAY